MAPEQAISADQVDARADLYSFGVILYEMLCGSRPVDAEDPATILEKLVRGEIHPLASRNPALPPVLCMLVDRLVAPNPDERPASAAYVRGELMRHVRMTGYAEQRPSRVPPTVPPVDQGTPPFVTSSQTAAVPRVATDAMPRMPDFAMAPTAVATAPQVVAPPRRRSVLGPILVVLFLGALGGGGAWAYMNQSIFDDSALPPLPTALPTATATTTTTAIQRIDEQLPRIQEPRRPPPVIQVRPTAEAPPVQTSPTAAQPTPSAATSPPAPTGFPQLPLPPFTLPSGFPSSFPTITLPSGLPPIFQQLPGFAPPAPAASSSKSSR
jgi:serine/threonine protein kinase